MGSPTYRARVCVLRKTKLGESDLILTALAVDGSILRFVARGARNPKNPTSSRLDLLCECEVLLAKGRSLDVVSDARLVDAHEPLRLDDVRLSCAAVIAEALDRLCHEDLAAERVYDMTAAALTRLEGTSREDSFALTAAFLLKLQALLGFRPSFDECVSCGEPIDLSAGGPVAFAAREGGALCESCARSAGVARQEREVLAWACALMRAPFADIPGFGMPEGLALRLLELCAFWISEQFLFALRSLAVLMALARA